MNFCHRNTSELINANILLYEFFSSNCSQIKPLIFSGDRQIQKHRVTVFLCPRNITDFYTSLIWHWFSEQWVSKWQWKVASEESILLCFTVFFPSGNWFATRQETEILLTCTKFIIYPVILVLRSQNETILSNVLPETAEQVCHIAFYSLLYFWIWWKLL